MRERILSLLAVAAAGLLSPGLAPPTGLRSAPRSMPDQAGRRAGGPHSPSVSGCPFHIRPLPEIATHIPGECAAAFSMPVCPANAQNLASWPGVVTKRRPSGPGHWWRATCPGETNPPAIYCPTPLPSGAPSFGHSRRRTTVWALDRPPHLPKELCAAFKNREFPQRRTATFRTALINMAAEDSSRACGVWNPGGYTITPFPVSALTILCQHSSWWAASGGTVSGR